MLAGMSGSGGPSIDPGGLRNLPEQPNIFPGAIAFGEWEPCGCHGFSDEIHLQTFRGRWWFCWGDEFPLADWLAWWYITYCNPSRVFFWSHNPATEVQRNDRETLIQALHEGGGAKPCKAGKTAMHYAADAGKCHGWMVGWFVVDCSHGIKLWIMVFPVSTDLIGIWEIPPKHQSVCWGSLGCERW